MSWSAASALLAISVLGGPEQELSSAEARVWAKVRPSMVTILSGGLATGVGVCVDSKGYFLAHKSVFPRRVQFGRLASGPQVELREVAFDETTQLVLLQAQGLAKGIIRAVPLGAEPERPGSTLLAVFPTGPVRAEFVNGDRIGLMGASQRLVPLNELKFEAVTAQIGGGLVFNPDGSLLGVLGATLGIGEQSRATQYGKTSDALPGTALGGGRGGGATITIPRPTAPQFGPAPQTVAYAVTSSVLQRVVTGLMSPSHKVLHPAIGVICRDWGGLGAEVAAVEVDSPADKAGILPGDIIVAIGGTEIKSQMDVGRITSRLRIGSTVEVKLKREGEEKTLKVGVGAT